MLLNKTESLREAQKLIEQGRVTSAMSIYERIVEGDSSDLAAISMLGDLYVRAGRVADAVEHFLRISENYLSSGSAISAAYILKKVLKIDPANPQALMSLGELDFRDKKMDRAHDNFIEAGAAFWNQGDITSAIQMNTRALEINPESRLAKVALALIEREKQEPEPPPEPPKPITKELPPIQEFRPIMGEPPVSDRPDLMISISDGSDSVCSPGMFNDNPMQNASPFLFESLGQTEAPMSAASEPVTRTLGTSDSTPPPQAPPDADEDSIIEQIATAEFLVGCGQVDQAIAQLRESLHHRPEHIQIREKLKDIYLRSEMIERASEECVNIAGIYAARGDSNRAKDYITRARLLISPEPYCSPAELRGVNLSALEETAEQSWSSDINQAVTVM